MNAYICPPHPLNGEQWWICGKCNKSHHLNGRGLDDSKRRAEECCYLADEPLDYRTAYTRYLEACRDFPHMIHEPPAEVPGEDCEAIRRQVRDELERATPIPGEPDYKALLEKVGAIICPGKPLGAIPEEAMSWLHKQDHIISDFISLGDSVKGIQAASQAFLDTLHTINNANDARSYKLDQAEARIKELEQENKVLKDKLESIRRTAAGPNLIHRLPLEKEKP